MVHHLLREASGEAEWRWGLTKDIKIPAGGFSRAFTTLGQSRGLSPMADDFICFASMICALAFISCS